MHSREWMWEQAAQLFSTAGKARESGDTELADILTEAARKCLDRLAEHERVETPWPGYLQTCTRSAMPTVYDRVVTLNWRPFLHSGMANYVEELCPRFSEEAGPSISRCTFSFTSADGPK